MNRHGRLVKERGDPFPTGRYQDMSSGMLGKGVLKLSRHRLVQLGLNPMGAERAGSSHRGTSGRDAWVLAEVIIPSGWLDRADGCQT